MYIFAPHVHICIDGFGYIVSSITVTDDTDILQPGKGTLFLVDAIFFLSG